MKAICKVKSNFKEDSEHNGLFNLESNDKKSVLSENDDIDSVYSIVVLSNKSRCLFYYIFRTAEERYS